MTMDELCQRVQDVVNWVREDYPRKIFTTEGRRRYRESLEKYFTRVLQPELHSCFPDTSSIVLGVISLMAYLVHGSTPPPSALYDELRVHADRHASARSDTEEPKMLVQLAIAYGCGWKRGARNHIERWDDKWPGALTELTDTAYNFVKQTIEILKNTVRGFETPPMNNVPLDENSLREFAALICIDFISIPNEDDPKYKQDRTIHRWNPKKGNLYGWLKRAINGGSIGPLRTNNFINGLLFPLLKSEKLLTKANVAFQECVEFDCDYRTEYNGKVRCGNDHCDGELRVIKKPRLVVPGIHLELEFWRCKKCNFYFRSDKDKCPYPNCGSERKYQRKCKLLGYPQDVWSDEEGDELQ